MKKPSKSAIFKKRKSKAIETLLVMQELAMGESKAIDRLSFEEVENWTNVFHILLRGDDARKYFGIKPRRGRQRKQKREITIANDYWSLRNSGEPDIVARKILAAKLGLSESRVYQIASSWTIFRNLSGK